MNMEQKEMKFESSMERLEQIVRALESGDRGLEESLKLYEEGITLVRSCNEALEQAEQSVKLLRLQPDGSVTLEDFQNGGMGS
ncbi:MAG: exodeoxyribonuclease VII small subunit [Clostridia bacterium]|jgi:exodeoxyribonuclease VII small subunit|nr:exodeoxyribonuclease VII small subunit [Clostridia bacterium]